MPAFGDARARSSAAVAGQSLGDVGFWAASSTEFGEHKPEVKDSSVGFPCSSSIYELLLAPLRISVIFPKATESGPGLSEKASALFGAPEGLCPVHLPWVFRMSTATSLTCSRDRSRLNST